MTAPQTPLPHERVRCRLLVAGRVQGVGFRFYAVRQARMLGVSGFVRNLPDGRVEAEAEGLRVAVEAFIDRMRLGPAGAVVREVRVEWAAPRGEEGFRIG
ncbi:MAG: acylphosphatase [Armatimonadota bacterium]|nr:acylphosphatase [Armatimonadota bacterium]MDR7427134.1 acylphosphatase [Armatimonadota bacterium]MDR7464215.1 acylphosphatase [Armatimonadota bacterium]MDR7469996.1 acylphosphatase [Armatimonadota bacterium]MDR7474098.1 acylphosphatase [Armatimonadota bacterium]